MAKITKRTVDATRAGAARIIVWDGELKGFGLVALPSGVKSYVYQYRNSHGVKRRLTIGKHGGSLTPDQARARAQELQRAVRDGRDPLEDKSERRNATTVGNLLDAYLASQAFAEKKPSTQTTDRSRIERHLRPLLGRLHVDALTTEAIKRAAAAIRTGKTAVVEKTGPRGLARVTGGEGTARKAIRILSAIFTWAGPRGERLIVANPCEGLSLGVDGERDTILEDADAYGRLFATLDAMEREHRVRSPVADAIRVIALTGARRGEITGLRWEHVDLKSGKITLPAARHKTGGKTGKPRDIRLPPVAQAIVARQPSGEPGDLVFRPAHGDRPASLAKPWRSIRKEASLPESLGLHGLRHTIASHLAMNGAQASEIMTALGHAQLSTAQKYVHWAQDARRALAERAASVALAGMALAEGKQAANVEPLKRSRTDG